MKRFSVVVLLAALVVTGPGLVWAIDEMPPGWSATAQFGLVGLARGQTARLSMVAVGGGQYNPNAPCVATLRFLAADGKPFLGPNGMPVATPPLPLVPGQAVSLDLPAAVAFGQSFARRVAFRANGDIAGLIDPELSCAKPVLTLEVFDTLSGRTEVVGSIDPELMPQSTGITDPELLPLGMMGLARGQAARLSLVAVEGQGQVPPNPCKATLGFVNEAGQVFTNANGLPVTAEFELNPGQTTELNLPGADVFRDSKAMRRQIRPTLSIAGFLDPELSCAKALVTVEIFDLLTGRTQVLGIISPEL